LANNSSTGLFNTPGSVSVNDNMTIAATSSAYSALAISATTGQAGLLIDQKDTGGDLFTASAAGTPKFTINQSGNVYIDGGNGLFRGLTVRENSSQSVFLGVDGNNDNSILATYGQPLQIYNDGAGGVGLQVNNNNYLGVGTTNTSLAFRLQVAGDVGPNADNT
jgi:hypothetical protein